MMGPNNSNNRVVSAFQASSDRTDSLSSLDEMEQLMQQLQFDTEDDDFNAEQAAKQLAHLTRKNSFRSAVMGAASAVPTIVELLSSSAALTTHMAATVQNLALEPEHVSELIGAGCLGPLLQLLLNVPDDSDAVLTAAAGAVSNLAYDTQACKTIATTPGCLKRLVQLLSHRNCVLRESAASVLGKVAWEPELCSPIAAAGAIEPLLSLLSSDVSDISGRHVAAAAIENLTYESTSIRKSVVEAGGVEPLVSLLDSNVEAAQRSAAGALHNLALARANCAKIAAAGGIEPLVELLETSGSESLQAVAGGTLGKLAVEPANRAEIVECREKLLESDDPNN